MVSILVVSQRYWPDGSGGELATHLIIDLLRKEKTLENCNYRFQVSNRTSWCEIRLRTFIIYGK